MSVPTTADVIIEPDVQVAVGQLESGSEHGGAGGALAIGLTRGSSSLQGCYDHEYCCNTDELYHDVIEKIEEDHLLGSIIVTVVSRDDWL